MFQHQATAPSCLASVAACLLGNAAIDPSVARGQTSGSIVQCPTIPAYPLPVPNGGFISVAGGDQHFLGLRRDGTISAWGFNIWGQCNVPPPNGNFVSCAAGRSHSLGLKSDGAIVAWGWNFFGECNVPPPNSGFVAVAGGAFHSLGLKADGVVVAWGNNDLGQCNVPPPNSDFMAIASHRHFSLGLKQDGSIVAWGDNSFGQCNVPPPNADFIAIAASSAHSLGLKSNGTIVAWGSNLWGECDVPPPNSGFVSIAAGGVIYDVCTRPPCQVVPASHSLGLKSNGTIVAWGYNDVGQCNVPAVTDGYMALGAGSKSSLGVRFRFGDVTGDALVDADDLVAVILSWGPCPQPPELCPADVAPVPGGDDLVNADDLIAVILHWGS